MTIQATIIVPTFDHGPTLLQSVASALGQTVTDIEVIVIGDGVPDSTRSIMTQLRRADSRVQFIDAPKHESRAEPTRDQVVREARGRTVCYLSDDDLYLPNHVETMLRLLDRADFAHALPVRVEANGSLWTWTVDLERPQHRRFILTVENRLPLSTVAHTRDAYLRLPHGWQTPPMGLPSDLHMWRTFLDQPDCRFASNARPTMFVFPSPLRAGWTLPQRVAELEQWRGRFDDPAWFSGVVADLLEQKAREAALWDGMHWEVREALEECRRARESR